MKFEDDTQNLKMRMTIIHGIVFAILAALGARLYFLQVVSGDYYAERAENQRVRLLRIPAPRGAIFDRNGKLLVDSRSTYNIILSAEDMKGKNLGRLCRTACGRPWRRARHPARAIRASEPAGRVRGGYGQGGR